MVERGWGRWGEAPYTDIMAALGRGPEAAGPGRRADGAGGRQLRRLHGQLGGRPHGPVPGDRHPRLALGPAAVPRHHGHGRRLGARDGRPVHPARAATTASRRRRTSARSRRRCSSSTASATSASRSARRLTLWTDLHAPRRPGSLPLLPRREPLDPEAEQRAALVRDGAGLPRRARPGQGVGPPGAALGASRPSNSIRIRFAT